MPAARKDHAHLLKYLRAGYPHGRNFFHPIQEKWHTADNFQDTLTILSQRDPFVFRLLWYYYATSIGRTNLSLYSYIDNSTFKRKINGMLNDLSSYLLPYGVVDPIEPVWLPEQKPMQAEHKHFLEYLRNGYRDKEDYIHPIKQVCITAEQVDAAMWELKQNQPKFHSLMCLYTHTQLNSFTIANLKRHDYCSLNRKIAKCINQLCHYIFMSDHIPQGENRIRIFPDSQ